MRLGAPTIWPASERNLPFDGQILRLRLRMTEPTAQEFFLIHITGAFEVAIVDRAPLMAIGRADRTVHIAVIAVDLEVAFLVSGHRMGSLMSFDGQVR
jgi:hypothetical protein